MDVFIKVLIAVLPACITGLLGFLVAKYNYHKNVPLDKLEIAYNRVYYPIYHYIWNNDRSVLQTIDFCEKYFYKYRKYVDELTIAIFNKLKESPEDIELFNNYKDNIYDNNSKLRRRLGYLESNSINKFTYSSCSEKSLRRILWEFFGTYITMLIFWFCDARIVKIIMGILSLFGIIIIICEFSLLFGFFIGKKILKLREKKNAKKKIK